MKKVFIALNLLALGLSINTSCMYGEILQGAMKEGAFRQHFSQKQFEAQTKIAQTLKTSWKGDAEKELTELKAKGESGMPATNPFAEMRAVMNKEKTQKRLALLTHISNNRRALKKEREESLRLEKALIDAKLSREFAEKLGFSAEVQTKVRATAIALHSTRLTRQEPEKDKDLVSAIKQRISKIEKEATELIKSVDTVTFSRPFALQTEFDNNTLLVYKYCENACAMIEQVPLLRALSLSRIKLEKAKAKNEQLRRELLNAKKA